MKMEEKQCFRKIRKPVDCQGEEPDIKCFTERVVEVSCKKTRCVEGKLSQNMSDGRKKGDPCKDAENEK